MTASTMGRPRINPDDPRPRASISPHERYRAAYLHPDHHQAIKAAAARVGLSIDDYLWRLYQGGFPSATADSPPLDWIGLRESLRLRLKLASSVVLDEVLREYGMPPE